MADPWNDIEGKVVLVTGASSGIGRDLCVNLAAAGCLIVAAARRIDRLRSLCDEINSSRPPSDRGTPAVRSATVAIDVSAKGAEIEAAVKEAWGAFGRIDVLINNAGIRGASMYMVWLIGSLLHFEVQIIPLNLGCEGRRLALHIRT